MHYWVKYTKPGDADERWLNLDDAGEMQRTGGETVIWSRTLLDNNGDAQFTAVARAIETPEELLAQIEQRSLNVAGQELP